ETMGIAWYRLRHIALSACWPIGGVILLRPDCCSARERLVIGPARSSWRAVSACLSSRPASIGMGYGYGTRRAEEATCGCTSLRCTICWYGMPLYTVSVLPLSTPRGA